jgi:hypothetical protein
VGPTCSRIKSRRSAPLRKACECGPSPACCAAAAQVCTSPTSPTLSTRAPPWTKKRRPGDAPACHRCGPLAAGAAVLCPSPGLSLHQLRICPPARPPPPPLQGHHRVPGAAPHRHAAQAAHGRHLLAAVRRRPCMWGCGREGPCRGRGEAQWRHLACSRWLARALCPLRCAPLLRPNPYIPLLRPPPLQRRRRAPGLLRHLGGHSRGGGARCWPPLRRGFPVDASLWRLPSSPSADPGD